MDDYEKYMKQEYYLWKHDRDGKLATIILFDQFSRQLFRRKREAFQADHIALNISLDIIKNSPEYEKYQVFEKVFILMPLQHNEDEATTGQCVTETEKLVRDYPDCGLELNLKYAKDHHKTILEY